MRSFTSELEDRVKDRISSMNPGWGFVSCIVLDTPEIQIFEVYLQCVDEVKFISMSCKIELEDEAQDLEDLVNEIVLKLLFS